MSITNLTKTATQRFTALCDAADEAQARQLATQRRIKSIEDQRRNVSEENDKATFDALNTEIERVSAQRDVQQESFVQQSRLVTAIRAWVAGLPPNVDLHDVETGKNMDLPDGETTDAGIDRVRCEIEKLQGIRSALTRAVPPIEDLRAAADAHVRELASKGRPSLSVDRGQLKIKHVVDSIWDGGLAKDALAVMAWLHPELLRDRLRAQIDEMRKDDLKRQLPVMSMAERDRKIADLDARILALGREEEFLIEVAEGFNMFVPRRENANPLAVLRLSLHRKKARAMA